MNQQTRFTPGPQKQSGISLVVVLIVLVVMTLVGLAAIRGTVLRERMSSNMYDRSLAFQSAESALREAEAAVRQAVLTGTPIGIDCSAAAASCPIPPANTYTGGGSEWVTTTAAPPSLAAGRSQYYIQFLGRRDSTDELNLGFSAGANQYGGGGGLPLESFYRVIARSHDPAGATDRSVVVLHSNLAIK